MIRIATRINRSIPLSLASARGYATNFKDRPSPFALPKKDQEEFERLQKEAMAKPIEVHPDARKNYDEFEGDVNPVTGEVGGPKQDPLRHGEWGFNGRVTDF